MLLPMANLQIFARADNARTFPAGQALLEAGQPGDEMFVIIEGTVDVFVGGHHLMTLGPGEIVGEMALVDEEHVRHADVRATTDVKLVPIDRKHFEFLVHNHPSFALEVMKTMVDRLHRMNEHVAKPA